MSGQQAKQPGALGQAWKPTPVVVGQPAVEAARPIAFEREEQAQGDEFAGIKLSLGMFGHVSHHRIDTNVQTNDNVVGRHANLCL